MGQLMIVEAIFDNCPYLKKGSSDYRRYQRRLATVSRACGSVRPRQSPNGTKILKWTTRQEDLQIGQLVRHNGDIMLFK